MFRFLAARLARCRQSGLSRLEVALLFACPWALWLFPSWRRGWRL